MMVKVSVVHLLECLLDPRIRELQYSFLAKERDQTSIMLNEEYVFSGIFGNLGIGQIL